MNTAVVGAASIRPTPKAKVLAGVIGAGLVAVGWPMLPNPADIDPKAVGANAPKAMVMDPTPNAKLVVDEGGGLAGRAARSCMNSDGTLVPNENAAPPEVDGVAWMSDNPNTNGAAKAIASPPLNGLDAGAGMVLTA